ncbi:MAG TPA: VCBS repeat-containing protein, partial [Acidobacteriota bacterium]|nr:VCBS repeat-containing protein [Acidobacteriota bacterium]
DTLAPGVKVGQRLPGGAADPGFDVIDWNRDGLPDLIHGLPITKPGSIYINQSTPGKPAFSSPIQPLDLPFVFWGAAFRPIDWNRDGDEDFLISSEFYLFWAEGSFVREGYRDATLVRIERQDRLDSSS